MMGQLNQPAERIEQTDLLNLTSFDAGQTQPMSPTKGMRAIVSVLNGIDYLSRVDGWLGGLCLTVLFFLMIAGIAIRGLSTIFLWLPKDLPIAWEYSSYLMAVTFTFGAAMTLRAGGHIRVRFLFGNASASRNRILETVSSIIAACFLAFFSYAMMHFAWLSYSFHERSLASDTPLWIPKFLVAIGVCLLALQFFARVLRAILNLPLEDRSMINNVAPRVEIPLTSSPS